MRRTILLLALALLAEFSSAACPIELLSVPQNDVCTGKRCDTEACPCGCECGSPSDPGACYVPSSKKKVVLITGATGRTGAHLYKLLASDATLAVRAFVRSADKARKVLGCKKCDASEGIYIGEVNDTAALTTAAAGASTVAIAVGLSGHEPASLGKAIEFVGVQNTVGALLTKANLAAQGGLAQFRVVLCSSMGTTDPAPKPMEGGSILFWKLNAEAFIASSGVPFAIVKPCGLMATPGNKTLLIGHDDSLLTTKPPIVAREDVARVMQAAIEFEGEPRMRFDLCAKPGVPQADLHKLLREAEYPWEA
jgi:uncharacterized protein YbjT (DUF2867 family)